MIIPSGGLSGHDTSEILKIALSDFVSSGGTLIVFTQQRGYEFTALPGGEVSAAGYTEDISCYTAGSQIDQYHPILAGQKDTVFDGGIDGYFLTWPTSSTILLRRSKNNAPALLVYPYGEGFVVASTLYTDYAGSTGQLTADETQMLKDLIVWLKNPAADFTETKSGESLTLNLSLTNLAAQDANRVALIVKDAAGQVFKEETVSVSVPAGQTVSYPYTFAAPSTLGNYIVSYALLFDNQTVQAQSFTQNFSVTEHLQSTTPAPELQFFVTAPGNLFPKDTPIPFTIRIKNNGDTEQTLTLSNWSHNHHGNAPIGTVVVPAREEVSIPYTTTLVYFYDGNVLKSWRWEMYLVAVNAQGQTLLNGWGTKVGLDGRVYIPQVTSSLSLDKKSYGPSAIGTAVLSLTNTTEGLFTADVNFSILSPNNQKIYETAQSGISLAGNEQKSVPVSFTLASTLIPGAYTVQASITRDGSEIGKAAGYFTVEKAKVAITPVISKPIHINSPHPFSFLVKNTGLVEIPSGNLSVKLLAPDGAVVFEDAQPFSLSVGEEKTLSFSVSLSSLQFGDYKLSYGAATEQGTVSGQTLLSSRAVTNVTFDKSGYKVRENAGAALLLTNAGDFEESVTVNTSAPTTDFTQSDTLTLLPGETKPLSYSFTLPGTLLSGSHPFTVTLQMANSEVRTWNFTVLPSRLVFSLNNLTYTQGDSGQIKVENKGGNDTSFSTALTLFDAENVALKTETGQDTLNWGETKFISFMLPSTNLKTGTYRLSLVATDNKLNKKIPFDAYIQVSGIGATLTTTTDKKVYKKGETVNVSTVITPTGNVSDATLHTKIYKKEPSVETFSQLGSTASVFSDGNIIWFGTAFKGAFKYDTLTKSFTNYLPGASIRAIAADAGYAYFATPSNVTRLHKQSGATKTFTIPDPTALAMDGNTLWIASSKGLYRLETLNEVLVHFTTQEGLIDNRVTALGVDGNTVLIGTYDKGMMKYNKLANAFSAVSLQAGATPARNFIKAIAVDEDAVFTGTLEGVVKMDKETGAQTAYTTTEGLANNWVYALSLDGNFLWVGTWEGLSKLDKTSGTFETLTTQDGLPSNFVKAIAVGKDNVYLGFFTH